jgi:DNA-3-methyladenine glycosylase II
VKHEQDVAVREGGEEGAGEQAGDVIKSEEVVESPGKRTRKVKVKVAVPPDVGERRAPTSTVETLLRDAEAHLVRVDPRLQPLIEKHHCKSLGHVP